jgi:carboxypeptidase C (cathepsin A)
MMPFARAALVTLALAAAASSAGVPALVAQAAPPDSARTRWQSHHSVPVGGQTVEYDATVGRILLQGDGDEPIAEVYYTSYERSGVADVASRPIVFAYNGGPGSSSFWLHMGVMGPRRVRTPSTDHAGPAPYQIQDNPYTLLDVADIVMVDPVGTGLSHPLGDTEGSRFWGIDEDARSLTEFIGRFLSRSGRWNSPKYLLGESYGTTRSAVLASTLQGANIDLNGIVLVSAVLDFRTILFGPSNDLAYVVNLPSYAATAWYLEALPGERPADLPPFLEEVEAFALGEYASALLAGGTLEAGRRSSVLDRLHRYTGLDRGFLERADLRVTAPEFEKELLRDRGLVVGRLDARFTGPTGDLLSQTPGHDPQSTAIRGAYTAAWNTYLRRELGYDGEREYVPSGNVQPWNWEHGQGIGFGLSGTPNVGPDLARALERNPTLEVLLVNGIYDLATPYFAAVWTMDHLGLPPDLRDNIGRVDFEAGHMMYVHEPSLPRWREALTAFIERTSGRAPARVSERPSGAG